jgi:leucyl-tRNA synthetase
MQGARDKYRELCGEVGMSRTVVLRYLEVQAIMLSPICPHVCEHVWTLLGKDGSILNTAWPVPGVVDMMVIQQSEYLMEATRDFRLKLKNIANVKPKKGAAPAPSTPPTHATVYVAKCYPAWQCVVLDTLRDMYKGSKDTVVDNKAVSVEMAKKPEVKKFMKKVMPFVAFTKEKVATSGLAALDTSLPWDEMKVLSENLSYIVTSLGLEGVDLALSSELGEKGEDCRPGAPIIQFRTEPSVALDLTNTQPFTGLFTTACPILQGDTVRNIARRLVRMERNMKDGSAVSLYRWTDPVLGPRTMPDMKNPLAGLTKVQEEEIFSIDLAKSIVKLGDLVIQQGLVFRVGDSAA